jgi:hypothetical protein
MATYEKGDIGRIVRGPYRGATAEVLANDHEQLVGYVLLRLRRHSKLKYQLEWLAPSYVELFTKTPN